MNSIRAMLLIMLFTSWTSSVMAERSHSSGSIRFYGTIVDGGCTVHLQRDNRLNTLCRQGGQQHDAQLATASAQSLPLRQGTTHFAWIDRSKALAVVTVAYY